MNIIYISGRFNPCFNCIDQRCSSTITVDFVGPEAKVDSIIIISSYNCGQKLAVGDVLYEKKKINDRELINIIFYHFMIPLIFVVLFESFRYSRSNSKFIKFFKDICCIPILQNDENINDNNRVHPYLVNEIQNENIQNNNQNSQNNNQNNNNDNNNPV